MGSTPRTLYLIKHGAPAIQASVAAHEWLLSDEGRGQATALAGRLASAPPAIVITSEEPKAWNTGVVVAQALGVPLRRMLGLHEHLRYSLAFIDAYADFEREFARFFARPSERLLGDESADEAHTRFANGVRAAMHSSEGDVALIAHGTVISLLVARANKLDAFQLWTGLNHGGFFAVEWPSLRIQRAKQERDAPVSAKVSRAKAATG
jgi:broad specificity phosphatase PhoE